MTTATFLFIFAITAGGSHAYNHSPPTPSNPVWRQSWVNAGQFYNPEGCHKAAANLGLTKTEYQCIDITKGEVK